MPGLDALLQFLAPLPRHRLGTFPTPLVRLDRLSARFNLDLWMKRDECSGLALGGNKARKLEFVLAAARAAGATTLVTVGPLTSNHTMMTATAARRAGFAMHCVISGPEPRTREAWHGNVLLLDYLGVHLHFVDVDYTDPGDPERVAARCREVTAATGGYFIPAGATMPAAEPGYMSCVVEIARQRGGTFDFDHVVLAYGTGSTATGLLLGLAVAGIPAQVWPVAIVSRRMVEEFARAPTLTQLAVESSAHFGLGLTEADLPPHDLVYGYGEEGYGVASAASDEAMRLMASEEGYFLDTIYTAKAFAGLIGLRRDRRLPAGARVLFVHTGGLSMTPAAEKRFHA